MQKIVASILLLFLGLSTVAQQSHPARPAPFSLADAWKAGVRRYVLVVRGLEEFRLRAETAGIRIVEVWKPARILVVEVEASAFPAKVLQGSDVLFADRADALPKEELLVPGHNLDVNAIRAAQQHFPETDGSPILLSIKETRFDTADVDLVHRSIHAPSGTVPASTAHPTIMATLAGGAGNAAGSGLGVAKGARFLSNGFNNLLPETDYWQTGVSVQNHSYGTDIENHYGAGALAYDQSVMDHRSLVHVFSAGNMGGESPPSGTYAGIPGFANLTGNFKMAKNALVVGAVDSFRQAALFSSRGPAFDGRLKPDLVAFGQDGSSGSAALVSGAAALVQHALLDQTDSLPDAALVRAVLLNSADDLGERGPDFVSGYGNMNLDRALNIIAKKHFTSTVVTPAAMQSFTISLPDSIQNLGVTLAWDDPPAIPGSSFSLINDLDLVVLGPDGQEWLPWVLDASPDISALRAAATRRRDSLNNVEHLSIDAPVPGNYTVSIRAKSMQSAAQRFSLVWEWEKSGRFYWQFPLKTAPPEAGREAVLRWQHSLPDSTGVLEYHLAGDTLWRLIDGAADLQQGWYRWAVPDVFAEACLRLRAGNKVFVSDTFMISRIPVVQTGFSCPDSVFLYWNSVAPVASYLLSGLGEKYMEPLLFLDDTFVVLRKTEFSQRRFAVTPVGQGGAEGARSPAPDVLQGTSCYIESFVAVLDDARRTQLALQIGTLYGVQSVQIDKWQDGVFLALQTWNLPVSKMLSCEDANPDPGVNLYRARIGLSNGGTGYSDTARVYLLETETLLVFPNPVQRGSISVLANVESEADFVLYDMQGRLLLETPLLDFPEEIILPTGLPGACYVYFLRVGRHLKKGGMLRMD